MLLFQRRFWAPIRSGKIRVTFRAWRTRRVSSGKTYRCGGIGRLLVRQVDPVAFGDLTPRDARAAGFPSIDDLRDALQAGGIRITKRTRVWRICFRTVEEAQASPAGRPSAAAVRKTLERLSQIDRRSRRGPWTTAVLRIIRDCPGVVSTELAYRLGKERKSFKSDVRRLKELGLTRSLAVGYELTPLGKAVLDKL